MSDKTTKKEWVYGTEPLGLESASIKRAPHLKNKPPAKLRQKKSGDKIWFLSQLSNTRES